MAKKTVKKVETPIDQRETFVSLQKDFADSSLNVGEKLKLLYSLQGADNDIDKLIHLRGELPAEVEALETEISELEDRVAKLKASVEEKNAIIAAAKVKIVEHDADIEKYQKQLESITNSREYDSINKELENTGLLRLIYLKNITEAKDKIEELRQVIDGINDRISIRTQDYVAKKEELEKIVGSTAEHEAKLRERREGFAAKLDARTLSAYNRIRESVHNHLAVVPVYNECACGGCFNTITPQRLVDIASGNKLIICEHCGRIIVNPDSE